MQTIILRPYDDEEIIEVYLVEHNSKKDFESQYEKALESVKRENPETWCLDQVFEKLQKKGWQILKPSTTILTY